MKIADHFTDKSIENIANTVFSGGDIKGTNSKSRILFLHGSKANEVLSIKSAKLMKKYYPTTQVVCFSGDAHCHKAFFQPEKWIAIVNEWLSA